MNKSEKFFFAGILLMIIPFLGFVVWSYWINAIFTPEELNELDMQGKGILVIVPLLTANAYKDGGFYDFYNGTCSEECLTVDIDRDVPWDYQSSQRAITRFEALRANMVTDYDLAGNTLMLSLYKTVVVLHSEYVTEDVYNALQKHSNVFYMYPNALYAEIAISDNPDRMKITGPDGAVKYHPIKGIAKMTLVSGHGYPEQTKNGFGWKYENTDEEHKTCDEYEYRKIDNGYQMTCWPQRILIDDHSIFSFILDL